MLPNGLHVSQCVLFATVLSYAAQRNSQMPSISCPSGTEPQKRSQGSYFELACRRPDGVLHGQFTEWYSDGSPKTEGQYTDAHPTGNWTLWQPGYKNAQGPVDGFRKGPRGDTLLNESGLWIYWYPNGQKRSEGNIFNGRNEGRWTEWFDSGKKSVEGVYRDGQRDGVWTKWFRSGQMQEESTYSQGRKNGPSTVWQENGKPLSQTEYDHGRVNGVYTTWYGNGQKERAEKLKQQLENNDNQDDVARIRETRSYFCTRFINIVTSSGYTS